MSHVLMAADAVHRIERMMPVRVGLAENGADKLLVAANAVLIQDLGIIARDLDRLVEVLERESLRVAIAVVGLADVFADAVRGGVAIVARGVIVMAGVLPAVILIPHDVAIDARLGI